VQYKELVKSIGHAIHTGRETAINQVNQALVQTYWEIGRYIVEFEQKGNVKAEYGTQLLDRLSKDLTLAYGKGFGRSNLFQIRQFYIRFEKVRTLSGQLEKIQTVSGQSEKIQTVSGQSEKIQTVSGQSGKIQTVSGQLKKGRKVSGQSEKIQTVSGQLKKGRKVSGQSGKIQTVSGQLEVIELSPRQFNLSWSHYIEILKAESDLEFSFYLRQCDQERWSVRELKRQMQSMLFHRIALQKNKKEVFRISNHGHKIEHPADLIKDPFVLEFLDIPEPHQFAETELEDKIISHLQQFIMEMGKGFAFIARQYRMSIAGRHFHVDILFYHRILKCFVLIDLKRGEIDHLDIGQMNLYLNYFKREEAADDDNAPIGIILGASKNNVLVEYALDGITNQILLAKYQLYLPPKDRLEALLQGLMEE
jgi:predicted nuclease of restriction endonuclease-like (RecB) superfamily